MSLKETLADFSTEVAFCAMFAPDSYLVSMSYEKNKAEILQYWAEAKSQLQRDAALIPAIDAQLAEMFAAFEAGDRKKGIDTAMALWNRNIKQME
ncbi:hypothetical protein [Ottowia cancrivicina]|uniref:Uncharacterized protein n=1 Tax=Ottowia cancrivicina TaxID=3040346 RepID=A0AAW6RFB7_9BURK|nr:hypothetical protein [Ottowia sp. 10c7w1]MDG9698834.1 hypothetical protein [Ottowia sp. 10c7w1]